MGDDFGRDAYFDFEVLQFEACFFESWQRGMELIGKFDDFVVAHVLKGLYGFLWGGDRFLACV